MKPITGINFHSMNELGVLNELTSISNSFKFPVHVILNIDVDMFTTETELLTNYYGFYYAVIKYLNIQSVLEIGVRAGYSMVAMLCANESLRYTGIDNDSNLSGGLSGCYKHAEELLGEYCINPESSITIKDSHTIEYLTENFDLVHIDGDHTTIGCKQDLELVRNNAKYLIVDDIDFCSKGEHNVRQAVDDFLSTYKYKSIYIPSYRGHRVIFLEGEHNVN